MSNLQPNYCLKFDFQKGDQHAGGKWLIHDTKRRKVWFTRMFTNTFHGVFREDNVSTVTPVAPFTNMD